MTKKQSAIDLELEEKFVDLVTDISLTYSDKKTKELWDAIHDYANKKQIEVLEEIMELEKWCGEINCGFAEKVEEKLEQLKSNQKES